MAVVNSFTFEGREFQIWSEDQLGRINREVLKQRAMDIRDHVGSDRLAPMPHHPEQLREWILKVQEMLMGSGGGGGGERSAPSASRSSGGGRSNAGGGGEPAERGDYGPPSGGRGEYGPPSGGRGESRPETPASDAGKAFNEANVGLRAAQERNRGSNIFG